MRLGQTQVIIAGILTVYAALLLAGAAQGQISAAPPADTRMTPPAPQKHGPPAGREPQLPGAAAPRPIMQKPDEGVVEGFVYWDTSAIVHKPAGTCSGLAVTVSVPNGLSGPFQGYKPLATLSNNFKYVGQVKTFLVGGKVVSYDVCTYGYPQLPVGTPLQVQVTVQQPTAFTRGANPQPMLVAPVTIINGQCSMRRSMNPTKFSDLTAHWGSCQNMAYDVNFAIHQQTAIQVLSAGGGTSPANSRNSGGLLSSGSPQGMLASGAPPSQSSGATSGALLGNRQGSSTPAGTQQNSSGKVSLNPQPLPPRSARDIHAAKGATRRIPVALSAPKQGRKIRNPKASLHDATVIAVLRKQSQAAAAEAAAMKLGIHPAGVQVGSGPSQTMAATAGGSPLTPSSRTPGGIRANGASHANFGNAVAAQLNNLALICAQDPGLRVLTVSGGPKPAIFTPDSQNNFYTMTGCSFGSPGANAKVYIYYQGTFREDFQIQEWTDNFIKLSLDQNITGVDDQNNVTLVVQRDDGKQWTKNGYQFYAVRQTVPLAQIPQQYFSLNRFRPDNSLTQTWKPTYTSASSASVVPNLAGLSAEVHWDITTDANGNLVGGDDIYDFSQLHSTFVLEDAGIEWRDLSCTDPNYNQLATSKPDWAINWSGSSGVKVTWQGEMCQNTPGSCGGAFQGDCFAAIPESNYGLGVSVTGPRGLDPWTGKPLP